MKQEVVNRQANANYKKRKYSVLKMSRAKSENKLILIYKELQKFFTVIWKSKRLHSRLNEVFWILCTTRVSATA